MTELSVIIVNLNTRQLLEDSLRSVLGQDIPGIEVMVIDNGSTDGSAEMVQSKFPAVRIVKNERNEGFAKPNNVGMRQTAGKYVFLLNSDTVVKPGAIKTLVSFLDAHPDVGACGVRLVYPDGRLQKSVKGFPTLWTHFCDMTALDKVFSGTTLFGRGEQAYFDYTRTQDVDHVMAAALLVRREVLTTTGLFDERFSIYYNDMDWCYRMKKSGWKISYVQDAEVVHHLGRTIGELNRGLEYLDELYDNTMLFYQKHYGRKAVVIYRLFLAMGFVPRTLFWWARRLFDHSGQAAHMSVFSWRSLILGVKFWKPVRSTQEGGRTDGG